MELINKMTELLDKMYQGWGLASNELIHETNTKLAKQLLLNMAEDLMSKGRKQEKDDYCLLLCQVADEYIQEVANNANSQRNQQPS